MTGLTGGRWAVASSGAGCGSGAGLAVHRCGPGGYRRLPAARLSRARRKTLVGVVTHAPAGTIMVMEKEPGGPAMWVRVGDGLQFPQRPEVWRG